MIVFLLLIPVLAASVAIGMYQLNGKREILKLDVVQFFYAFVLAPIMFVWAKSVLFFNLRSELTTTVTSIEIFLIDTLFSLFFLYVFAFIVMHSLTKSINLKVGKDPFHDIFKHAEYFHLWVSHLVMFLGGAFLLTILGIVNSIFPLNFDLKDFYRYFFVLAGFISGLVVFVGIWLSDPKQESVRFMKIIKLVYGVLLIAHILFYFIFNPAFRVEYALFWASTTLFSTYVLCSFFVYKSAKAKTFLEKIADQLKHTLWDTRVQLFNELPKKPNETNRFAKRKV